MRVLIPLDNRGGGGIARVGEELVRALAGELAGDDRLLLMGASPELAALPQTAVLRGARPGRSRVAGRLEDQLRMVGPARHADLLHGIDAKAPLLSTTAASITVHDVHFLDHPEWFPRTVVAYKRALLTASLRRARLVVCVSQDTVERLRAHHPEAFTRSRVAMIHSGVTPAPDALAATQSPRDYFLTVSAIEPRKNHLGLLRAFQSARRQGLRLRWKIVGRPQYDAEPILEELSTADGVDLVGRVSDPELERLYTGARFVATPSFEEGFGLPPLEAMKRGIAVVSSTGSALDETVGDGGLRVAAQDVEGWASALLALESDDALLTRLRAAGRLQAERFSWDQAARRYLEEFRAVTTARRST